MHASSFPPYAGYEFDPDVLTDPSTVPGDRYADEPYDPNAVHLDSSHLEDDRPSSVRPARHRSRAFDDAMRLIHVDYTKTLGSLLRAAERSNTAITPSAQEFLALEIAGAGGSDYCLYDTVAVDRVPYSLSAARSHVVRACDRVLDLGDALTLLSVVVTDTYLIGDTSILALGSMHCTGGRFERVRSLTDILLRKPRGNPTPHVIALGSYVLNGMRVVCTIPAKTDPSVCRKNLETSALWPPGYHVLRTRTR